ncbi:MAG TPA: SDR family oxidoreductase [Stellaceae bacterium]|nr:SDR family oxidoreductase [Stellaceae bacterium]
MAVEQDKGAAGVRRLRDKVCVVTGAGQGIGRAAALRLGAEGARVVVADRIEEGAAATVALLRDAGAASVKVLADVSSFAGAQRLVAETLAAYGRLDVLVNNVGGTIWIKPYHLYGEDEVRLELERSLHPTLWCCLAALPVMMQQGSGAIVNLASQSVRGLYRAPYAASKGGIIALTKVLAMEYGRHGIRVNAVSPGGTDIPDRITPRRLVRPGMMVEDVEGAEAYAAEMRADIRSQQALKRRGTPEDQAAAIAFLASDDADFITGETINCSGGQS